MSWVLRSFGLVLCLASLLSAQPNRPGQPGEGGPSAEAVPTGPPVKQGRILELETKGRITTAKIETTEGESYEVKLTPQFEFFTVGKGDAGFIRPGVYITGRGVRTNGTVFLTKATIYVFPKGKRPPPGGITKAIVQEGESLETYNVAGELTAAAPAEGYPEHTALALKGASKAQAVWLEPGFQIDVASADPAHVASGADVELAMKALRGGKLQPAALRVYRAADFNSEEILGAVEKKDE